MTGLQRKLGKPLEKDEWHRGIWAGYPRRAAQKALSSLCADSSTRWRLKEECFFNTIITYVRQKRRASPENALEHIGGYMEIEKIIQEMVDFETKGWNTKDPELFLSMIHPDMAWPWPPTAKSHDPIDWVFIMGRLTGNGGEKYGKSFLIHMT